MFSYSTNVRQVWKIAYISKDSSCIHGVLFFVLVTHYILLVQSIPSSFSLSFLFFFVSSVASNV